VRLQAGDTAAYSHIVFAIWSEREDCSAEDTQDKQSADGCTLYKYRFRNVDDEEYPAPIDAWPRPSCDLVSLRRAGFFGDKDPINLPRRLRGLAQLNDCWNLTRSPGLGFSIQRWRAAPLSSLAQNP
jgi:hypothetical protein